MSSDDIIGYDCEDKPIRIGDIVEWIEDRQDPPERRRVISPVDPRGNSYPVDEHEGGYLRVTAMSDRSRGYHQRFGMNLRVVATDSDLVMDAGL